MVCSFPMQRDSLCSFWHAEPTFNPTKFPLSAQAAEFPADPAKAQNSGNPAAHTYRTAQITKM
jgi:hypothetical protein